MLILCAYRNTTENALLRIFFRDYLVSFWNNCDVIWWGSESQTGWKDLFDCKNLRDTFLFHLNKDKDELGDCMCGETADFFENSAYPRLLSSIGDESD